MNETAYQSFAPMFAAAIDETGITKDAIANEMGVHVASLYRLLSSSAPSKRNVRNAVRAINKLAMYTVVDEAQALRAAGYEVEIDPEDVDTVLIASVIDLMASLPQPVQADVLEIVRALHKKHAA